MNFKFLFPLTPICCLFITYRDLDTDSGLSLTKTIEIIHADKAAVDLVNEATFQLSMEECLRTAKKCSMGFGKWAIKETSAIHTGQSWQHWAD